MLLLIWKKKPWPSSQYGYFAYFGLYSKLFVTRILVLARCYGFTWQESVYSINTLVLPRGWVGKTGMFWSEILKDVNCFPIQYERRKTHFEFKTVITCSTFLLKIFKTFMLYIFLLILLHKWKQKYQFILYSVKIKKIICVYEFLFSGLQNIRS